MKIKFVSAPCGAGKSKAMVQYIKHNPGYRYVIVQPTNKLLVQTAGYLDFFETDYFKLNRTVIKKKVLTSETIDGNLMEVIINELGADIGADVILITDKMFHRVPVDKMIGFKIFMDDCTDVMSIDVRGIKAKDQDWLRPIYKMLFKRQDYFVADETKDLNIGINARYSYCTRDVEGFSEDIRRMSNTFSQMDYYHHMIIDNNVFNNTSEQISVIGWYDFRRYAKLDLTIMMNNFENSLMYKMFPGLFIRDDINITLPDVKHNHSRLKVKYFKDVIRKTDKLSLSKLKNHDFSGIQKYLENENGLLWTTNNDSILELPGQRITVQQRGINSFIDKTRFGFFFACNPHPQAIEHLQNVFGLSAEDWKEEKEYEEMVQFAYRTNLRDWNSDKEVIGFVYDSEQAEVFERLGATIEKVTVKMQADKKRKKRAKENSPREISKEITIIPEKIRHNFKIWKSRNKDKLTIEAYNKWEQRVLSKNKNLTSEHLIHLRKQIN